MIYKFIDENGSEITVNTLSSLQSLVESNTIKKKTKIKSGLRGKWTEASKIEELKDFFVKKEQSPTPLVEDEEVQIEEIAEVETVPELGNVEVKKPAEIVTDAIIVEEELPIQAEDKQVEKEKENNSISEEEKIISESEIGLYDDSNLIPLNFLDAIKLCFKNYFNFRDRASRSEYWWFSLAYYSTILFVSFLQSTSSSLSVLFSLIFFISIIPSISVTVRRLHDLNKSGFYLLITFIPILGGLILLIMTVEKGTLGDNDYGSYPLKFTNPNLKNNFSSIQSTSYEDKDSSENWIDRVRQNESDRAEKEGQAIALINSKEYILRKKEKQNKELIIGGLVLFLIVILFYFSNTKTEIKNEGAANILQNKPKKEIPKKNNTINSNKKISDNEILFNGNVYKYSLETNQVLFNIRDVTCVTFESVNKILKKCINEFVVDYEVVRDASALSISFSTSTYLKKQNSEIWFKKRAITVAMSDNIQLGGWISTKQPDILIYGAYDLGLDKWIALSNQDPSKGISLTGLSQSEIDNYIRKAKKEYAKALKNKKEFEDLFSFYLVD